MKVYQRIKERADLLIILTAWLVAVLVVNPIGAFPLNDDWAYAKIVKRLLDTGVYDLGTWPAMSLLTHVLWGALFCKIFGFSFTVLRISVLILGIFSSILFYRLVWRLTYNRFWSLIACLSLVFNPLFFSLSFTYMTDVTFLTLCLTAVYFYKKALLDDRIIHWAVATALSVLAVLTRQLGLLIPLAFAFVVVVKRRNFRSLSIAVLSVFACWAALKLYMLYLENGPGISEVFGQPGQLLDRMNYDYLSTQFRIRPGIFFFYWAIFILPVLVLLPLPKWRSWPQLVQLLLVTAVVAYFTKVGWPYLPSGNVWNLNRIGPVTLTDVNKWSGLLRPLSAELWLAIKWSAFLGAVVLINHLLTKFIWGVRNRNSLSAEQWWKVALAIAILLFSLFLLLDYNRFDRYFLPVIPLFILLLSTKSTTAAYHPLRKTVAVAIVVFMAGFSVSATHDYLAWSKLRWTVLTDLVEKKGISPKRIDGGFEFNGWFEAGPRNPGKNLSKSWWFVTDDEYSIGLGAYACFSAIDSFEVNTFLNPVGDSLFLLQRPAFSEIDTIRCDAESISADTTQFLSSHRDYRISIGAFRDTLRAHSGRFSMLLTPEKPFAMSTKLYGVKPCDQLTLTVWRRGGPRSAGIVAATPKVDDFHLFEKDFTDLRDADWQRVRHEITIPPDMPSDTLKIYLWNPLQDSIWMDDLEIIWRKSSFEKGR